MVIIREDVSPDLYRLVEDRNLQHQYFLLETMVILGLAVRSIRLTSGFVCELNRAAVRFLTFAPGQYREDHAHIVGSSHEPPHWHDVPNYMAQFFDYLDRNWEQATPTHLAAYAMWRLNWIHPFEEGNGRTARAACYFLLCVKHAQWLPGRRTIMGQIKRNPKPYYEAIKNADDQYRIHGSADVHEMEVYLDRLLVNQLNS